MLPEPPGPTEFAQSSSWSVFASNKSQSCMYQMSPHTPQQRSIVYSMIQRTKTREIMGSWPGASAGDRVHMSTAGGKPKYSSNMAVGNLHQPVGRLAITQSSLVRSHRPGAGARESGTGRHAAGVIITFVQRVGEWWKLEKAAWSWMWTAIIIMVVVAVAVVFVLVLVLIRVLDFGFVVVLVFVLVVVVVDVVVVVAVVVVAGVVVVVAVAVAVVAVAGAAVVVVAVVVAAAGGGGRGRLANVNTIFATTTLLIGVLYGRLQLIPATCVPIPRDSANEKWNS